MPYQPPTPETLKALETVPNMYLILSPDLFILTASDKYLEATQNTREGIVGKHIFEAFPDNPLLPDADGVQNINDSLQEVLRTKKPHYMRIQRYDVPDIANPGQFIQRYWDPSHTPVLNEDGSIHYIIQLATNVTDKVLADEQLEQRINEHQKLEISERHFRQLADIVPAKISNALPNGEVTFFNQKWLDYAGMSFEELRDFGYQKMMHPDEVAGFQAQLAKAAEKKESLETEMRFKDINGNYRWHLNIASPILNEKGEITMWVGSTTDIQRIKEEELRKTAFIGMVSHELKTPLTSLFAHLQILQQKFANSDDQFIKRSIQLSIKGARKMTRMINSFLNVARLESGEMAIHRSVFDMQSLFAETEEETALLNTNHKVIFTCKDKSPVYGDWDKIGQVLTNLLSNAAKYSPNGSTIIADCTNKGSHIVVTVKDEGSGINPKELEHIFERYYRSDSQKQVSGFGIGLYLCAEIIKYHNGKIWAESEPGKGSAFHFELPLEGS